jgi:hypothetical protein
LQKRERGATQRPSPLPFLEVFFGVSVEVESQTGGARSSHTGAMLK